METVNANTTIFKKILEIQSKVSSLKKDKKGHNHKYADLNQIIQMLQKPLHENGLGITHNVAITDTGGFVCVTTVFDEDGQTVISNCPILGAENLVRGNAMQGMGAGITFARRYNLLNLFNLFAEDDDAASMGAKNASDKQVKMIMDLLEQAGDTLDYEAFYKFTGTQDMSQLTQAKANQTITMLKKKVEDARG